MDAVTYPDEKVIDFIAKNVIPLKLFFDVRPAADDYNVKRTPTLITVNGGGKEHHRTVGFLPPEELIPSLLLGIGKVFFDQERIADAFKYFEKIVKEYPKSD
jgi:thioredoxin-related protein